MKLYAYKSEEKNLGGHGLPAPKKSATKSKDKE